MVAETSNSGHGLCYCPLTNRTYGGSREGINFLLLRQSARGALPSMGRGESSGTHGARGPRDVGGRGLLDIGHPFCGCVLRQLLRLGRGETQSWLGVGRGEERE